jgi:hypothetical protein
MECASDPEEDQANYASSQAQDMWDDGAIINMFQTALEFHADPTDPAFQSAAGDASAVAWHYRKPFGARPPSDYDSDNEPNGDHSNNSSIPQSTSIESPTQPPAGPGSVSNTVMEAAAVSETKDILFSLARADQHKQLEELMFGKDTQHAQQQRQQGEVVLKRVVSKHATTMSVAAAPQGRLRQVPQQIQQSQRISRSRMQGTPAPRTSSGQQTEKHTNDMQQRQQQQQQQQQQHMPQQAPGVPGMNTMPGPPIGGLQGMDDDGLSNLLWSWYYAGYNTGRYQAIQQMKSQPRR